MTDRIPCINLRCRRTAPAAKYEPSTEIICGNCFRALPLRLKERRRALERRERRIERLIVKRNARGTINAGLRWRARSAVKRLLVANWEDIKSYFVAPDAPPVGLEGFLQEVGL